MFNYWSYIRVLGLQKGLGLPLKGVSRRFMHPKADLWFWENYGLADMAGRSGGSAQVELHSLDAHRVAPKWVRFTFGA